MPPVAFLLYCAPALRIKATSGPYGSGAHDAKLVTGLRTKHNSIQFMPFMIPHKRPARSHGMQRCMPKKDVYDKALPARAASSAGAQHVQSCQALNDIHTT